MRNKLPRLATTRMALPIALLRAREAVMERFRPMLSSHGITEQQWRVLRVIQEFEELDAGQLAHHACILGPSLSRILKTLEAEQFISIKKDPNDRRRWLIRPKIKAQKFIEEVTPESSAIYAAIQKQLGSERVTTLLDELDALLAALSPRK